MGNGYQQSIEIEATAREKLDIAAKNLRSDQLATLTPWKDLVPAGIDHIHLDDGADSQGLEVVSLYLDVIVQNQIHRMEEVARNRKWTMMVADDDGSFHFFERINDEKVVERFLPWYWYPTNKGLKHWLQIRIARRASASAERGSAAMINGQGKAEQPQVQIVNGGGTSADEKR